MAPHPPRQICTLFSEMPQIFACQISINAESRQDFLGIASPKSSFSILMNHIGGFSWVIPAEAGCQSCQPS